MGLRLDALSVYCIHKFGWFESGWSLGFLKRMIVDAGFWPVVFEGKGLGAAGVFVARRLGPGEAFEQIQALTADRDAIRAERDVLKAERDTLVGSKSWRLTQPLRWVSSKLPHV